MLLNITVMQSFKKDITKIFFQNCFLRHFDSGDTLLNSELSKVSPEFPNLITDETVFEFIFEYPGSKPLENIYNHDSGTGDFEDVKALAHAYQDLLLF